MTSFPKITDRRRAPALALIALAGIVQAIAAGFAAFATRDVFAALSSDGPMPEAALATLIASGVLIALLRVAERCAGEYAGQHFAAELRQTLFLHLTRVPPRMLSQRRSGTLSLRFVGDLSAIRLWVSAGVVRIISASFVIPGILAVLWLLNPQLAAIGGVALLAAFLMMAVVQIGLSPLHRRLRKLRARIAGDMSERVPVAAELRLQGRVRREATKLSRTATRLRQVAVRRAAIAAGLIAVPEICLAFAGTAFLVAAFQIGLSGAEVAASLGLLGILAMPLNRLAGVWDRYRAWQVARGKCCDLLDIAQDPPRKRSRPTAPKTGLSFTKVSAASLRDITVRAKVGSRVAIIGPNGAGKSTLLGLAAGLDSAEQGQVMLNGRKVSRRDICYVGPRSPLLRGSLRRAFTMGQQRRVPDPEILAAASTYGLQDVINRLGGLDGRLAEGGRNLSSGEICRVHLVRASLASPKLLLLDEPDDALDPQGRNLVAKLMRDTEATTLCVTHDLALARQADVIWYVEDGRLLASGPASGLLSEPGPALDFASIRHVA